MCGICGFYGFEDNNVLKRMINVIRHRGPDDSGVYINDNVSLGHVRLSIIDLSEKGRQPMQNEEGNIWISYNGETYNFVELRKNLEKNHIFRSNTDTEVLIHAYEEYGLNFIQKIKGMFAFALYDEEKGKLILARDPMGKKPLYYCKDNKNLIFASEIKAILESGIKRKIDFSGLSSFLAYQYTIGRNTMFEGIKKVLPGEIIIFDTKTGNISNKKYWDINENVIDSSEDFFVKTLKRLLEESAKLRTIADVPVGAFLSGGLDSTAVVGLIKPNVDYDLHTFSMGFGNLFSELDYAKIVSEQYNTIHHEIEISSKEVIRDIEKIAWHYDEPIGDTAIIANYFLSKEAKKYVKVVVAGEGGDELFGGYPYYNTGLITKNYFLLPQTIQKNLNLALSQLLPKEGLIKTRWQYSLNYFRQSNFELASFYRTKTGMTDEELEWASSGNLKFDNSQIIFPDTDINDSLNKMLIMDCKNMLPEKYLMKADKATMANSIEGRLPLIDETIVNFAFQIPPNLKIKNGDEKYILKMAVKDFVPHEIIKRKKIGFSVPSRHWVKNEMKEIIEKVITEGQLSNTLFETEKLERLLKSNKHGWSRPSAVIWNLFALELWHKQYF